MTNGVKVANTDAGRAWTDQDLRILVLGPFRVNRLGAEVPARTRQVGRVGSALAVSPGVPVSRERLVHTVWGENPPTTVVNTLQVYVSQLRSIAGKDLIATAGDGYVLAVEPSLVDAEWFKWEVLECVESSENGHAQAVRRRLETALSVWVGDPFSDLDDPEVAARRSELVELHKRAREVHLDLSLRLATTPRSISEVIAAAKGQISREPLREAGYRVLIGALMADGRPVEAADAYRSAVEFFESRAGVLPSPQLEAALGVKF